MLIESQAQMCHAQSVFDQAEQFHRQALDMARRVMDPQDERIARILDNLGNTMKAAGKFDQALANYSAALAIQRTIASGKTPQTISSLSNLGRTLVELNRPAEAEPLLREALEM